MNYINTRKLNNDILYNLYALPSDVDLIVGIPRSGMLVASLIALYLNKPLTDIDSFLARRLTSIGNTKNTTKCITDFSEIKKVLIVEDSVDTGRSLKKAKSRIEDANFNIEYTYLAAYVTASSKEFVDLYFDVIEQPRKFEWNFMHKEDLINACVDIDGVLCFDPTNQENDDGEKYINFIKNARPKYVPTCKIGYIVTSRLEKYRDETEKWLKDNGIEYKELIMMNANSKEERQKLGNHGTFKGRVFKEKKDAKWFIESEYIQAMEIKKISKKSVICVDDTVEYVGNNKKSKLRNTLKRLLKKMLNPTQYEYLKNIKNRR